MIEKVWKIRFGSQIFGIGFALLILCCIIGISEYFIRETPVFFRYDNLLNILLQTSVNTIIAVGMTFIIITAGIDLSVGSSLALCNVSVGLSMLAISGVGDFLQVFTGILVGLIAGSAVGFANGFIIVRGRIPPFIVTLGMLGIVRGLALCFIGSQTENLIGKVSPSFSFIGNGSLFSVPFPAILALIVVGISHILLSNVRFGRYIIAIGANEEAARLSGINIYMYKLLVYTIGGLMVGLAGIIQTSRLGSSNPTIGVGFELYAIAAVIIGGTSLMGGRGTIIGTLFGALIIGVLNNGLTLMNIPDEIKQIIIGLVIIGAVLWDRFRKMD